MTHQGRAGCDRMAVDEAAAADDDSRALGKGAFHLSEALTRLVD